MTAVPSRLNASDGRRIAPRKSAWPASCSRTAAFCLSSVKWLVTTASTPPGFRASTRLGDEEVVEGELLAVEVELDVGEGDVADHGVERRELGVAEVLDADVGLGMERAGDAAGDGVELDADEPLAGRGVGHEIPDPASRLEDDGVGGDPETRKGVVHGRHDDGGGEELAEGRPLGGVVFLGGEERLELLADGLPAVLEAAGDGSGKIERATAPKPPKRGGPALVVGGRAVLALDGLERADRGEDVAGFGFFAGRGSDGIWSMVPPDV